MSNKFRYAVWCMGTADMGSLWMNFNDLQAARKYRNKAARNNPQFTFDVFERLPRRKKRSK